MILFLASFIAWCKMSVCQKMKPQQALVLSRPNYAANRSMIGQKIWWCDVNCQCLCALITVMISWWATLVCNNWKHEYLWKQEAPQCNAKRIQVFNHQAFYYKTTMTIPETSVAFQRSVRIHVTFVPTHKVGFNSSKQKYTRHLSSNAMLYFHVTSRYTHAELSIKWSYIL